MGRSRQSRYAGAARRSAARYRAERHGRIGVIAPDIGRDLRHGFWRGGIPGAGPLRRTCHTGDLVGRGRLHAAGASGRPLRPHRASRALDPVCHSRGDAGCGQCRRDRDPEQARGSSGSAGLDRAVCDRHARCTGARADICAGKGLADDRAGADVGRHRLDFDAAADSVPARARRHPRRHRGAADRLRAAHCRQRRRHHADLQLAVVGLRYSCRLVLGRQHLPATWRR